MDIFDTDVGLRESSDNLVGISNHKCGTGGYPARWIGRHMRCCPMALCPAPSRDGLGEPLVRDGGISSPMDWQAHEALPDCTVPSTIERWTNRTTSAGLGDSQPDALAGT